ncbi:DUF4426 domain-containing protein [Aeromonas schubertii]|uniref:DUF4426 domain-containing protein n=1 Tax=Aeromonas schubertii TaxID=652 RepID=A0ABS7V8G3_9GAMM|nr:DUF4426 domain-containing protein [Aeromonas schubertii]MBZ6065679.1 DUF4426 domain-containing protein [Aeromonas schubertii]
MMRAWLGALLGMMLSLPGQAEQMKEVGPWNVHYSAFASSFLTPEVATQYQVERSRYNGIINIAVQDKQGIPQSVGITGEARNLTGTVRPLYFREVREGKAIYYLAELPYRNEDTYRITLTLMGNGQRWPLEFQHTFYVE